MKEHQTPSPNLPPHLVSPPPSQQIHRVNCPQQSCQVIAISGQESKPGKSWDHRQTCFLVRRLVMSVILGKALGVLGDRAPRDSLPPPQCLLSTGSSADMVRRHRLQNWPSEACGQMGWRSWGFSSYAVPSPQPWQGWLMEAAFHSLKNRSKNCVQDLYRNLSQTIHTDTTFAHEQLLLGSEHEQWRQHGPLSPSGRATFTPQENPGLLYVRPLLKQRNPFFQLALPWKGTRGGAGLCEV